MIKQMLLVGFFGTVLLIGVGCFASQINQNVSQIEGEWQLTFALPSDWVMVKEYSEPEKKVVTPSQEVTKELPSVVLQSTNKAIVRISTPDVVVPVDSYINSDFSKIIVYLLDPRRKIPSDAKNLGNGFFQDTVVSNNCTGDSICQATYYYVASTGEKYLFSLYTNKQRIDTAQSVVLSAKVVIVE